MRRRRGRRPRRGAAGHTAAPARAARRSARSTCPAPAGGGGQEVFACVPWSALSSCSANAWRSARSTCPFIYDWGQPGVLASAALLPSSQGDARPGVLLLSQFFPSSPHMAPYTHVLVWVGLVHGRAQLQQPGHLLHVLRAHRAQQLVQGGGSLRSLPLGCPTVNRARIARIACSTFARRPQDGSSSGQHVRLEQQPALCTTCTLSGEKRTLACRSWFCRRATQRLPHAPCPNVRSTHSAILAVPQLSRRACAGSAHWHDMRTHACTALQGLLARTISGSSGSCLRFL